MLMLAGILGLFVSGAVAALPLMPGGEDADADAGDAERDESPEGESTAMLDIVAPAASPDSPVAGLTDIEGGKSTPPVVETIAPQNPVSPVIDAPEALAADARIEAEPAESARAIPADAAPLAPGALAGVLSEANVSVAELLDAALPEPEDLFPPRDAVGGDHLTDHLAGSSIAPAPIEGDAIIGSDGSDHIVGGSGADLILGNGGDDRLTGGDGRDILMGGDGNDSLSGDGGDDELHGDWGDDDLAGGSDNDLLSGGDGDDRLDGGDGNDRIFGGTGADTLLGGVGDDILDGTILEDGAEGDEGDLLDGGEGNDTLAGGFGDRLTGGDGADTFLLRMPSSADLAVETGEDSPLAPVIEDFDPASDAIEVLYDGLGIPQIEIVESVEGTELLIDEVSIARLAGTSGFGVEHIRLVRGI